MERPLEHPLSATKFIPLADGSVWEFSESYKVAQTLRKHMPPECQRAMLLGDLSGLAYHNDRPDTPYVVYCTPWEGVTVHQLLRVAFGAMDRADWGGPEWDTPLGWMLKRLVVLPAEAFQAEWVLVELAR